MNDASDVQPAVNGARLRPHPLGGRLCYLPRPASGSLDHEFERIAALGFSHVVIPPAFGAGSVSGELLAIDLEAASPRLDGGVTPDAVARWAAGA